MLTRVQVVGTWDDHDYGKNDAGQEFVGKWQQRDLYLDFLSEDRWSERYTRQGGIYTNYIVSSNDLTVNLVLLDVRFDYDKATGDRLGQKQWEWLEQTLQLQTDVTIVASGVQVMPDRFGLIESFSPKAKLFEMLP